MQYPNQPNLPHALLQPRVSHRCQRHCGKYTAQPDVLRTKLEALSQPKHPNQKKVRPSQIKEVMSRLRNTWKLLKV